MKASTGCIVSASIWSVLFIGLLIAGIIHQILDPANSGSNGGWAAFILLVVIVLPWIVMLFSGEKMEMSDVADVLGASDSNPLRSVSISKTKLYDGCGIHLKSPDVFEALPVYMVPAHSPGSIRVCLAHSESISAIKVCLVKRGYPGATAIWLSN